jgi:hypothetical protein
MRVILRERNFNGHVLDMKSVRAGLLGIACQVLGCVVVSALWVPGRVLVVWMIDTGRQPLVDKPVHTPNWVLDGRAQVAVGVDVSDLQLSAIAHGIQPYVLVRDLGPALCRD